MENNNINYQIVFSEETSPIISSIIEKYNLESADDSLDYIEKLGSEEDFIDPREIILSLVMGCLNNRVNINSLSDLLKTRLNISKEVSEQITEDIKNKLLAIGKKIKAEEYIKISKPSNITFPDTSDLPIIKKPPIINEADNEYEKNISRKKILPKKVNQKTEQSLNDSYREPIE